MPLQIQNYYRRYDQIVQYGGSRNEMSIRAAFANLLNEYAERRHLYVVQELYVKGTHGKNVRPDGVLKNALRLDYGYWESKDESDNIDEEIDKKIAKGYPLTNILFEDSQQAVLLQHGQEVMRVNMREEKELDRILQAFISYEHAEVREFNQALEKFKEDLPTIIEVLRDTIDKQGKTNTVYIAARDAFLEKCRKEINPSITVEDVREMIIQHILTSEIFNAVFDESWFHRENNIARELEKLIHTFFTGDLRRNTLGQIDHYYKTINRSAANIADHHEKQRFLKNLYENFYKVYNPKGADRLGVVYTPEEIVRFMVESTDYLLHRHFGRTLKDHNVEILDPATGTGTFITDLIEYIPKQYLEYKYLNEIHANEVAILPYYIANLNIEYTYRQKMGEYKGFPNICFVDTLDNTAALTYANQQLTIDYFSSENAERIKRQNEKKISVIIGNPPYNANQQNENDNNKNREYDFIDKRIKNTFVKLSAAHKTKVYDMYSRFFMWAFDRLDRNGVIAFITNRSFIDSRTFDGFRKYIQGNFDYCYIVDTKSDVRANPKIAGATHNVFGIQTGVAISFLIRKEENREKHCSIHYVALDDYMRKEDKLEWIKQHPIDQIEFERIEPSDRNNWLNLTDNNWEDLIPVTAPKLSGKASSKIEPVIFQLASFGNVSARDEWVYDFNESHLKKKIDFYFSEYNKTRKSFPKPLPADWEFQLGGKIKWSQDMRAYLKRDLDLKVDYELIRKSIYRPFVVKQFYFSQYANWSLYQLPKIFSKGESLNKVICYSGPASSKPFQSLAFRFPFNFDTLEKTQCLPLYRYDKEGNRHDNITDWGLAQFRAHYEDEGITKEDIFHYTYAVLHHPAYREKYALNLKRDFPRLPYYDDFHQWAAWGKALMDLHIHYEEAQPYPLDRRENITDKVAEKQGEFFARAQEPEALYSRKPKLKVKLKAYKEKGIIEIDEQTALHGIPPQAWAYKLGNRSALEWILDQYKEKKPKDETIREKFNTYRFADYKEQVIDLLMRVCTVSVETMKVVEAMP